MVRTLWPVRTLLAALLEGPTSVQDRPLPAPTSLLSSSAREPVARIEQTGVPWYLWCAALSVTSAYVGGYWDISWHRSIGRDTFWTPPHIVIYACGVLASVSSAYLIFAATFRRATALRRISVRIWGLSGPVGAFVSAWGSLAMLVSAPFDD